MAEKTVLSLRLDSAIPASLFLQNYNPREAHVRLRTRVECTEEPRKWVLLALCALSKKRAHSDWKNECKSGCEFGHKLLPKKQILLVTTIDNRRNPYHILNQVSTEEKTTSTAHRQYGPYKGIRYRRLRVPPMN